MNSSPRRRRRDPLRLRNYVIVGALLAMLVAGVAGRIRQAPAMAAVPDLGGVYTEAVVGKPSYINPILGQVNQIDKDLTSLIFSGLTRFDESGQIVPDLAERWDASEGGKRYTFYLRKGLRWHDGVPLTAGDIVFTIKTIQGKDFPGSTEVADLWRSIDVDQVDETTVRFTLKETFAPFLEYTTMGIIPRHLYSVTPGKDMLSSQYNLRPIGTGPFVLTKISSEGITLEPFREFYGPAPHISQLRFKFYPDYSTALSGLEKGDVDALPYVDAQDVPLLSKKEELQVYGTTDYSRYTVLYLNDAAPIFKDRAVRTAVACGIDKQRIVQTVLGGQGAPGRGAISPASWAYDSQYPGYAFDPKRAESILETAGWRDTDGDGIREKDGAPLSFVILTNDNRRRIRAGELVAEDLRRIGLKVEVQAVGWGDLLKEYISPHKFTAAIAEQWMLTVDPDVFTLWHSSQIESPGLNFSSASNPRMDELLDEAKSTIDRATRKQLYSQFQATWMDEAPAVVLYYPAFTWAISRNVKDVKLGYLVDGSSRFRNVAEWYMKTKMVPVKTK